MTVVDFGVPNTMRLVLKQDGDKLTGTLSNQGARRHGRGSQSHLQGRQPGSEREVPGRAPGWSGNAGRPYNQRSRPEVLLSEIISKYAGHVVVGRDLDVY